MIDKSKTYRTRDGREVRIYATDGAQPYCVHGAVKTDGRWNGTAWMPDGAYALHSERQTEVMDLIEVKPRIQRKVWVNVYPENCGLPCESKGEADCVPGAVLGFRIACVELTIDCAEGDGL